jgi:phosphatidylinositol glycan class B
LFAAVYAIPESSAKLLTLFPQFRAIILIYLPKLVQALFAALGDYYTWKFAERIYGRGSYTAWTAVRIRNMLHTLQHI